MVHFDQSKILPYPAQYLFDLVLDVESYPTFLPGCKASKIITQTDDYILADLVISYKGFTEKYRSKITTNVMEGLYEIDVQAISGPFKFLQNNWKFYSIKESNAIEKCQIHFSISFEFKNILLDKLIGMFFRTATTKTIEAFERRAESTYK